MEYKHVENYIFFFNKTEFHEIEKEMSSYLFSIQFERTRKSFSLKLYIMFIWRRNKNRFHTVPIHQTKESFPKEVNLFGGNPTMATMI